MKYKKLFKVKLRGLNTWQTPNNQFVYVVAYDPNEAYEIVKEHFDKRNYGFSNERELESVELLAEQYQYTNCPHQLMITQDGAKQLKV